MDIICILAFVILLYCLFELRDYLKPRIELYKIWNKKRIKMLNRVKKAKKHSKRFSK